MYGADPLELGDALTRCGIEGGKSALKAGSEVLRQWELMGTPHPAPQHCQGHGDPTGLGDPLL